MTQLHKVRLTLGDDKIHLFNQFCEQNDISYRVQDIELGDVTNGWITLSKAENRLLATNHLTFLERINVSGVYCIGYGGKTINSFTSNNCIYIGESAAKYSSVKRTGAAQRLHMAVRDFSGLSSNNNGKFFKKRQEIAEQFGDATFDISKLRFAVRPHEDHSKWDKGYSHKMEIEALKQFKKTHNIMPQCNSMTGTHTL